MYLIAANERSTFIPGYDCSQIQTAKVLQYRVCIVHSFRSGHVYTIFTPFPALFTPFIHRKRYSCISTNKEVHMDLIYLGLAVILAALTVGMAYAISRSNGRN